MPSISILCASSFASRASAKLSNVKKPNAVRWPDRLFATMLHFWIGLINFEISQLLVGFMGWNFQGWSISTVFIYPENFKKIHQRKLEIKKSSPQSFHNAQKCVSIRPHLFDSTNWKWPACLTPHHYDSDPSLIVGDFLIFKNRIFQKLLICHFIQLWKYCGLSVSDIDVVRDCVSF